MNAIYTINYAIFSIFMAFLIMEIGFALTLIIDYRNYSGKVRMMINPIWEITGTFGVFYIVNYEISYPKILVAIANAYVIPILIAAIFLLLRNAFIAFGDYSGDRSSHAFGFIYSASTLIVAILAVSVLTSGISGIGLLGSGKAGIWFLVNPFNLLVIISILIFSISVASSIIGYQRSNIIGSIASVAGFGIAFGSMYLYLPEFAHALKANPTLVVISVILLAASVLLQLRKIRYAWILNIISIIAFINMFGILTYPYIFGTQSVLAYAASPSIASPANIITAIGGSIVAISLCILVYVNYMRRNAPPVVPAQNL